MSSSVGDINFAFVTLVHHWIIMVNREEEAMEPVVWDLGIVR